MSIDYPNLHLIFLSMNDFCSPVCIHPTFASISFQFWSGSREKEGYPCTGHGACLDGLVLVADLELIPCHVFLLCFIYHKYLNPKVIRYVMYTLIQINRSQHAFVIK